MLRYCIICAIFSLKWAQSLRIDLDDPWTTFKDRFKRKYLDDEDDRRRSIWKNNMMKISTHNIEADLGFHTYKMEINDFSDMKKCGSCWAISALGALEGQRFASTGILTSLSTQTLLDCANNFPNNGCLGGNLLAAFDFLYFNGGVGPDAYYPYKAKKEDCKFNPKEVIANISGYVYISPGDEKTLKHAVGIIGPVGSSINADPKSLMHYSSGIYSDPTCDPDNPNHGVLVVGYGKEKNTDYWIIKNSWGPKWGEKGYAKIRMHHNECGIATEAAFPKI